MNTNASVPTAMADRPGAISLLDLPTPVRRLGTFGRGVTISLKFDDCGLVAGGGNKLRKLQCLAADALAQGADMLVTTGALQSNHARLTAGVAAQMGLGCTLLLADLLDDEPAEYRSNGNRLLASLLGADCVLLERGADIGAALAEAAAGLREAGRRPYVIPFGGSNLVGCLGYVDCAAEIAAQYRGHALPDAIYLACGSGGTYAGLLAGLMLHGLDVPVIGMTIFDSATSAGARIEALLIDLARHLGLDRERLLGRVRLDESALGGGYGVPSDRVFGTIRQFAARTGVVLDPVYTGKAMSGVLDRIAADTAGEILFIHTGGLPIVFGYASAFAGTAGQS